MLRLAVCLLLALGAACAAPPPPGELSALLRPHDVVHRPAGEGPFPAVVVLHGCGGRKDWHGGRWGRWLAARGYLALEVDSLTPRGLESRTVCQGLALWGSSRAADVWVSLADLRRHPDVDPQRLALLGFSHGGWAALDSLTLAQPGQLDGLGAVAVLYPYCGAAASHRAGWSVPLPVLMLLAGADREVSRPACEEVARSQIKRGQPLELHVYAGAGHAFDAEAEARLTEDAQNRVQRFLSRTFKGRQQNEKRGRR